jgi:hypothetical protein
VGRRVRACAREGGGGGAEYTENYSSIPYSLKLLSTLDCTC